MRAFLPFLLLVSPLMAQQPAVVSGRVLNQETREGIPAAAVTLADDRRTAGSEGRFRIEPVQPGTHVVLVQAIGYRPASREVVVLPGQVINLVIELTPAIHQLDSVTISAERNPVIGRDQLVARGSDLATALNGWEGVIVSRTGYGNEAVAQVRGSAADEVLVLVDGFSLNDPFTGRADLSRVPVQDVETISLLRGVQSARAGSRAVAGVITISTRREQRPQLLLGIGSDRARRARVAGSAGSLDAALSVEELPREYTIDLPSGGTGERLNADGQIWNLSARGRLGVDWTLRGSLSDRGLPGTSVNPTPGAHAKDRSLLLGLRTGRNLWISSSLQWLDTRVEDSLPPPGFLAYDNHTWGWGGTAEAGWRHRVSISGWNGEYHIAVDARHDRFDGDAVRSDANFTRAGTAVAASLSRAGNSATWTVSPAARLDWFTGQARPIASGRIDLDLALGRTGLSAAVGNGVTVPALADLLFRDGVGVALNPDLRPERVRWEVELGGRQRFALGRGAGSLRVGGFYGQVDDLILWTPDFRNIWSPGNFAVRRGGGEATLDFGLGDIAFAGTVAYNSVRYDSPGGSQVPYRPRFSTSLESSWSPGPWRLSLGWNHLGTRYSRNRGMNPLAPFDLVHVGLARRVGLVTIGAEVRDLTDARPVYIAGFPTPGRTVHLSINLEMP